MMGKSAAKFRPYTLFFAIIAANIVLWLIKPTLGIESAQSTASYLGEMLSILPPIFVLVGLLDVWVPRQIVERNVGNGSSIKGVLIVFLVGTAAAGPLYAAFPVADTMLRKGCSIKNALIFLGAWATVKIPMLVMEVRFLGWKFALVRLALTVPTIILIANITEVVLRLRQVKLAQCNQALE